MAGIQRNPRLFFARLVLYLGAALLVFIGWTVWYVTRSKELDVNLARASDLSGIAGVQPANVQLGLLCDYYEHDREHVPPFQSDGVMQRREWFYTPPHEPFELLRSKLNAPEDENLAQLLVGLRTQWEEHAELREVDLADLKSSLERSSLAPEALLESGRAMAFFAGDQVATVFFHAGLEKALVQYGNFRAGDPLAIPALRQLAQTKALQRLADYDGLEKRFALEMALYPPLSVEARRAGCLCAAALFDQAKVPQAADAIVQVFEQDRQVGDLDPAGLAEMDWRTQRYLAAAGRFEEAIPYCMDLCATNNSRKMTAARLWVAYLRHLGRDSEADAVRDRYKLAPVSRSTPATRPVADIRRRGSTSCNLRETMSRSMLLPVLTLMLLANPATAQDMAAPPPDAQKLRLELQNNPRETVDRLNNTAMRKLLEAHQYEAVEQLAVAGTLALPADTWRIEPLQQYRVRALLAEHKTQEALQAAKGLFNVCSLGFVKDALPLLFDTLAAAHPEDPGIVPRFKRQILAGAQEDPAERQRLLDKYGGNTIMRSIQADPGPYEVALAQRKNLTAWRDRYGNGNLLLLSGRIADARQVFTLVYQTRPGSELRYASEAIAKLIKAEDGGLGRANQFVRSIRPAP
jgi:hypothetical protein